LIGKRAKSEERKAKPGGPRILSRLDGTLIDSVYQHILAWREALEQIGLPVSNASIQGRIGAAISFCDLSCANVDAQLSTEEIEPVKKLQSDAYRHRFSEVHSLPGASDLPSTFSK
jgi:beta-phosphoglucomutase-like phosphatase (HAD superfamily)